VQRRFVIDPLFLFLAAGIFTPGPNVILLTASGARFGFRRTLPHMAGVVLGVALPAAAVAFGVGAAMLAFPALRVAFQVVAVCWILWMAWGLLRAEQRRDEGAERPMTFLQAVLFQWVNPKLWSIALAAAAGYGSGLPAHLEALRIGSAFSGINLFACLFWVGAGTVLSYLLRTPLAWRAFTTVMAALLAGSGVMVLFV
jgi:threonine/homoserine/homoserine lactone efflux protein